MPEIVYKLAMQKQDIQSLPIDPPHPSIHGYPRDNFTIRRITAESHPAKGQLGLFSKRDLGFTLDEPPASVLFSRNPGNVKNLGMLLMKYTGVYIMTMNDEKKEKTDGSGRYVFDLVTLPEKTLVGTDDPSKSVTVSIDAEPIGSEGTYRHHNILVCVDVCYSRCRSCFLYAFVVIPVSLIGSHSIVVFILPP